ncbi:hypothetical protein C8F01DRAFT_146018 [Mycena amicta]|nr:hypothetical protein C8F01DRAFT_146018 [Mycena amicta]
MSTPGFCHEIWYLSTHCESQNRTRLLEQQQQPMFNSKFFALASMALLIGSSTVSAQLSIFCNDDGVSGNCAPFINTFCSSVAFPINVSDSAARCFTTGTPNLRCDFAAVNTAGTGTGVLTIENCETALNTVAAVCPPQGGNGQFAGGFFKFFMDPNSGACAPQCGS